MSGFKVYHRKDDYQNGIIFAVQITEENMKSLAIATRSNMWVGNDGVARLMFKDTSLGSESAEVGDYILTDMGGRYWPAAKELFELEFVE